MSSTARSNSVAAICVKASLRLEAAATTTHPAVIRMSSVISRTSGSSSTTIVRRGTASVVIAGLNPQDEDDSIEPDREITVKPARLISDRRGPAGFARQHFFDQPRAEPPAYRRHNAWAAGFRPGQIEPLIPIVPDNAELALPHGQRAILRGIGRQLL